MWLYGGGRNAHQQKSRFSQADTMPTYKNESGKTKKNPWTKHTEPLHVPPPPLTGSARRRRHYHWIHRRRMHPPIIRRWRMRQPWIRAGPRSATRGHVHLPPDRATLYRTPSLPIRFLARCEACSKLPSRWRPPTTREEWLDICLHLPTTRTDVGSPPWCTWVSPSLLHATHAAAG